MCVWFFTKNVRRQVWSVTPILHETGCMRASIEYKSERTPRGVQTKMLYICANNSKCRTLLTGSVGNDCPSFISVLIPIHIRSRVGADVRCQPLTSPLRTFHCAPQPRHFSSHASAWRSRIIRREGASNLAEELCFLMSCLDFLNYSWLNHDPTMNHYIVLVTWDYIGKKVQLSAKSQIFIYLYIYDIYRFIYLLIIMH